MSTMDETKTVDYTEQDAKKLKQLKITYPIHSLGGGIPKTFTGTYMSYLYTNIYMMPAAFSGIISLCSQIIGWVGGPVFGTIIDKISFRGAKYYPWIILGSTILYLNNLLIYWLPVFGIKGYAGAICALVIGVVNALTGPFSSVPNNAVFPLLSTNPSDRQYFAKMQKFCRDGAKTIFSPIFPFLLPLVINWCGNGAADASSNAEAWGYALCCVIAVVPPLVTSWIWAFSLKGSYVERNAMTKARKAKKSLSLGVMFKNVLTNRPLLAMFLFMGTHKCYYFIYTGLTVYMFKYVFDDFAMMGVFNTVFNLTAIFGVMFGPVWKKIFKETKRCFVMCMVVHVAILAVIALFFKSMSFMMFLVLFGASSVFMGLLENYILPMFAAASDYGAWKTGVRLDALSMSIYSLSIKTGTLVSTAIRTVVMVAADLDSVTAGGPITDKFINTFSFAWAWGPLILAVLATMVLLFLFNLNDEKIAWINEDIKNGITAAESTHKI